MFLELATLMTAYMLWFCFNTYLSRRKMPPGPFPLPIIGNIHQTGSNPPFSMGNLRKKYGDIYTVTFPIGTFVIVNNGQVARELMSKDDFACRPGATTFPSMEVFEGKNIVYSDLGPNYIFRRKIVTSALHVFGEGVQLAEERVNFEIQDLLDRLNSTNGQAFCIREQLSMTMINVIMEWLFSKRYEFGHPTLRMLADLDEKMMTLFRQGSFYQVLPFLKYLPNTGIAVCLDEVIKIRDDFLAKELKEHYKTRQDDVIRDITDALLAAFEKEKLKNSNKNIGSYEDIKYLLVDIVIGATGTITSTLTWMILFLVLNQDVQKKLHQELDDVIGKERLPCWKDGEDLPYLFATICETMRYSVFIPCLPRKANKDSVIQGYHIPKETGVLINLWHIQTNSKDWKDPESFKPDRFLDDDGKFLGWNSVTNFIPFGAGRRMCLGQALGKMDTFAAASRMLHQFRFDIPPGEEEPTREGVTGLIRFPKHTMICAYPRA